MAWEIRNANREQKHITFMKREDSLGKCLALPNHAESILLDLQLTTWYTSVGEQKALFWKKWTQISIPMTTMVVEKCHDFSNSHRKMRFEKLIYSTKYFIH